MFSLLASFALFLSFVSPLLVVPLMFAFAKTFRREWQGTWQGHRVLVQNYLNEELLYIDGKLLARGGNGWAKFESTLTGELEGQIVMAIIKPSRMLTAVSAEVYIGGVAIALEEAPAGTFENTERGAASSGREPADPRWHALTRLVDQIVRVAPEQADLGLAVKEQVRDLLSELEDLSAAREAHALLDTSGAGVDGVAKLHQAREGLIQQLLHAVQALHLSAMSGRADSTVLRDLMARLEVEVDAGPDRVAPAVAARRQLH